MNSPPNYRRSPKLTPRLPRHPPFTSGPTRAVETPKEERRTTRSPAPGPTLRTNRRDANRVPGSFAEGADEDRQHRADRRVAPGLDRGKCRKNDGFEQTRTDSAYAPGFRRSIASDQEERGSSARRRHRRIVVSGGEGRGRQSRAGYAEACPTAWTSPMETLPRSIGSSNSARSMRNCSTRRSSRRSCRTASRRSRWLARSASST